MIGISIESHVSNKRLNWIDVHPFSSWPNKGNQSVVVLSMTGRAIPTECRSLTKWTNRYWLHFRRNPNTYLKMNFASLIHASNINITSSHSTNSMYEKNYDWQYQSKPNYLPGLIPKAIHPVVFTCNSNIISRSVSSTFPKDQQHLFEAPLNACR